METSQTAFLIVPVVMLIVALIKKTGTAAWMAIGMCFGLGVMLSDPSGFDAMVWGCIANSVLIMAMFYHFNEAKTFLPVLMAMTLVTEVFLNFVNLIAVSNGFSYIEPIGWITGLMSWVQVALVIVFDDKKGSLNYVLDGFGNIFGSSKHVGSRYKH